MSIENKKIDSNYKVPSPIKGEDIPPNSRLKGIDKGMPVNDKIIPSEEEETSFHSASADTPQIPLPQGEDEGMKNALFKGANTNPWLKNSFLGPFIAIQLDILKVQKESGFILKLKQIDVSEESFNLGLINSDLAQKTKNSEAIQAMTQSIVDGATALFSLKHAKDTIATRGAAERKVQGQIDAKEQELADLKIQGPGDPSKKGTVSAGTDKDDMTKPSSKPVSDEDKKEFKKDVKKKEKEIEHLKAEKESNILRTTSHEDMQLQSQFQAQQQGLKAIGEVVTAICKVQEGVYAKEKELNDTVNQVFNRLNEGLNKGADDARSQTDRTTQSIVQTVSDMQKAFQMGRG